MLKILGAPFAGPLAMLVFFFDLIPVIGATIAAFLVAIVMLFVNFPVGLIVWIVFAIIYQQVENYLIQPQIQKRATEIEPFVVLVAVLFDPDGGLDADRHSRVARVPAQPDRRPRRRPAPRRRAGARPALSGRACLSRSGRAAP